MSQHNMPQFGPQMPNTDFGDIFGSTNPFAGAAIPENPFGGFPVKAGGQSVKRGEDPRLFYNFNMEPEVEYFRMSVEDIEAQKKLARIYKEAADQKIIMVEPVTKQFDAATSSFLVFAVYYRVAWTPKEGA